MTGLDQLDLQAYEWVSRSLLDLTCAALDVYIHKQETRKCQVHILPVMVFTHMGFV